MEGRYLAATMGGTWTDTLGPLHVGDQIFRRFTLRDEDGILTDSTVAGTLMRSGATTVNLTGVKESTGVYLVTFPVFAAAGIYTWRIASTGAVNRVERGRLRVRV